MLLTEEEKKEYLNPVRVSYHPPSVLNDKCHNNKVKSLLRLFLPLLPHAQGWCSVVELLLEAECREARVKNRLSLCEGKQIASVSDFSLPQWIVPSCWLRSKTGLFVLQ